MATKRAVHPLQKPVHPMLRNAILAGGVILAVIAIIAVILLNASTSTTKLASNVTTPPTSPLTRTATPTPVDMSDWKTYTDWKYGYSVKLPPEFASYIPTKGYTGDAIDPDGSGFVQFEDTTLTGSYPNRTSKYGFSFRIEKGTPGGSNCTTDKECLNLIKNNTVGRATVVPLQARILNRDLQGLSMQPATAPGNDISIEYFYPFTVNGMVFTANINFYYPKSFQETQTKAPVINAILASITFPNQ